MQDADLFIGLAGIAGVSVGFGALIAARSDGPTEPVEFAPMRAVVSMGMLAVVAALAPVTLGGFELGAHQVWALSSAAVPAGWFAIWGASAGTPEYRAAWAAELEATRARSRPLWLSIAASVAFAIYLVVTLLSPVVIVVGLAPDLEPALYFAVVVLILLGAGWSLMGLVYQPRPAPLA